MTDTQKSKTDSPTQLAAYLAEHGSEIIIRGKAYRFENIRKEQDLGGFADVFTQRAKYLGMQTAGTVIGRPGAESWVILRLSGGGATLAKFAFHNGRLLELA
jgi:hypothetical protein